MPVADLNMLKAARSRQSLRFFLEEMVIACRPKPRRFVEVADAWQWSKVLDPLIPSIESVAGLRDTPIEYDTFAYFMHKGADKTSVAARVTTWGINFAPRRMDFVVCARDRDQARSLRDAMEQERILNPWLPSSYKINNYDAEGANGTVEIISSDAKGGHGRRANIYVMDEWAMWKDRELSDMVLSSSTKYTDCIIIILSNCGYKQSFQHQVYERMRVDPRSYVFHPQGIIASWIDKKKVERLRANLAPSEGRRLYDNEFVDASEESAFPEELINEAFSLSSTSDFTMPRLDDEE